ncbi:type IV secretory system conjugative DNA transfer family protein [Kocuria marina]|uniref:type IV secretory system conjugative DNA transfer family protein n=1 Tax=Kocuria marina TaxID=223184 RepID=UPI00119D5FD5|nr:TraM recognition domain-containing protein [Kocuria indica]
MQSNEDMWGKLLGGLIGMLVAVWLLVVVLASLVALVQCGQLPQRLGPGAVLGLFRYGKQALATESGCAPSTTAMGVLVLVFLVLVAALVVAGVIMWLRWRESDRKLLLDLRWRRGIAKAPEVRRKAGRKALMQKASVVRPTLDDPQAEDVGWKLGSSQGREVWVSSEDSVVILGPPRSGKGFFIAINALLDAPGAVVTTSTRGDNVRAVWEARKRIGPVALFDPQGLTKLPTTLKWHPAQGCESAMTAARRAQAIVGASSMGQSTSNQEWAGVATQIMQYLLHAAAIGEVDAPTLGRWGASPGLAEQAVRILKESPAAAAGWGEALDAELNSDPRMLPSKWMGVTSATSSLMLPEVADVLNPAWGEGLEPEKFLKEKGTLFLVGTKSGGGAAGPMLMALMDAITWAARDMAISLPGNRLDPPLSLILDEIANMAAWRELPTIMSDGGGVGISTLVILQSPGQARAQWGQYETEQILGSATVTVQLGGSSGAEDLGRIVSLAGQRKITDQSRTSSDSGVSVAEQSRQDDVVTVSELRRLPTGTGFMLKANVRPVVVTMSRWTQRKDAEEIKAAIARFDKRLAQALTSGAETVGR